MALVALPLEERACSPFLLPPMEPAHPRPDQNARDMEPALKTVIMDVVGTGARCDRFIAHLIKDEYETISALVCAFKEHRLDDPMPEDALRGLLKAAPRSISLAVPFCEIRMLAF